MDRRLLVASSDPALVEDYFGPLASEIEPLDSLDAFLVRLRQEHEALPPVPAGIKIYGEQRLQAVAPIDADPSAKRIAPRSWRYDGSSIGVAILGGGVKPAPDVFEERLRPLPGYPPLEDSDAHTTQVAEVLAGNSPVSAAPGATLYSAVVRGPTDVAEAIHKVIRFNDDTGREGPPVRIIYMSLETPSSAGQEQALANLVWAAYGRGISTVVPAGNDSAPMLRPAMAPHAITVGTVYNGGTGGDATDDTWVEGPVDVHLGKPNVLCADGAYPLLSGKAIRGASPASAYVAGFLAAMFHAAPALTPAGVFRILEKASRKPWNDPMPMSPPGWYGSIDFSLALVLAEAWPKLPSW